MSRAPVRGQETALLLVAVALGVFWAVGSTDYAQVQPWNAGLLLAGFLVAAAVVRRTAGAPWLTLAYAVTVGVADRLPRSPIDESDVMKATEEAIGVLASGQNPYAHFLTSTNPPGSLLPYPPGELFFYAIPRAIFGQI